jgi:hypothetical protein
MTRRDATASLVDAVEELPALNKKTRAVTSVQVLIVHPQCRSFLANPSVAIPNKLDCVFQYGIDPHPHMLLREPNLTIYKAATTEMVDRRFIDVI